MRKFDFFVPIRRQKISIECFANGVLERVLSPFTFENCKYSFKYITFLYLRKLPAIKRCFKKLKIYDE